MIAIKKLYSDVTKSVTSQCPTRGTEVEKYHVVTSSNCQSTLMVLSFLNFEIDKFQSFVFPVFFFLSDLVTMTTQNTSCISFPVAFIAPLSTRSLHECDKHKHRTYTSAVFLLNLRRRLG